MRLPHVLVFAGGLAIAGTASFAASNTETIEQKLSNGEISEQQVEELIQFTGLTADEAKQETLEQVVAKRWQQN